MCPDWKTRIDISLKNTKKHCMPVTVLVHAHAHVRVTLYMQRILIIQI